MQSISMQSTPVKDRRRILGEKDANACLSPAYRKDTASATGNPVKRALFAVTSPKKLLPSPIFAGQKRTREQVDETDLNSALVQAPRSESETSELSREPSSHNTSSAIYNTQNQPSHASDAMDVHLLSQQHDSIHNDLDAIEPSNLSEIPEKFPCTVPEDPDARKMFIQEKATLLRTRIQSAMRNVTDHQFDRRVSELEAHSRKCPRLSLTALSTPAALSSRQLPTPSQTKTPHLPFGCTPDLNYTSSDNTPDLPQQPFLASTAAEKPPYVDASQTPAKEDGSSREQGEPMQLSSPPAPDYDPTEPETPVEEARPQGGVAREEQARPPSQRGDAVDALLKLMSTADRQHGSCESWSG